MGKRDQLSSSDTEVHSPAKKKKVSISSQLQIKEFEKPSQEGTPKAPFVKDHGQEDSGSDFEAEQDSGSEFEEENTPPKKGSKKGSSASKKPASAKPKAAPKSKAKPKKSPAQSKVPAKVDPPQPKVTALKTQPSKEPVKQKPISQGKPLNLPAQPVRSGLVGNGLKGKSLADILGKPAVRKSGLMKKVSE